VAKNIDETGCDAVMSAEALLWDPRIFADPQRPVLTGRSFHCDKPTRLDAIQTALEYLQFVRTYPVDLSFAKAHLFKIVYHSYEVHPTMRNNLGNFDIHTNDLSFLWGHLLELQKMEETSDVTGSLPQTQKEAKQVLRKEEDALFDEILGTCSIDFSDYSEE
jgi:tRNA-dihydrouridine synthase